MMTEQGADERGEDGATRRLKRRGILAAAGAAVAGIVAKQASAPVTAAPTYLTLSNNDYTTNVSTATTILEAGGGAAGQPAFLINAGSASSAGVDGLHAQASPTANGVVGMGGVTYFGSPTPGGSGVVGTGGTAERMQGFGGTGGSGVVGNGGAGTIGGDGVVATGFNGGDRYGNGRGGNGVTAFAGTGPTDGTGVYGQSTKGIGVYGVSTSGLYGVRGDAGTAPGAAGLLGVATDSHAIAFGSVVSGTATIAGYFNGEVHVEGPFYVDPVSNKHGVIAHPDGSKRVLYSMEAPESWIEDFGTGQFVNGKATVTLDHDFAAITHADDYHVFLTEYGDNNALFVAKRSATDFAVHAKNATSSGTFSWRVVAKPNVGKVVERLPKYTRPVFPMPAPTPHLSPPKKA